MSEYQEKREKAARNLKRYLIFCGAFTVFNVAVIAVVPSYRFPDNFFAIWPIVGWGVPTIWRFFELGRYRERA